MEDEDLEIELFRIQQVYEEEIEKLRPVWRKKNPEVYDAPDPPKWLIPDWSE